jgi:hypothetical protein
MLSVLHVNGSGATDHCRWVLGRRNEFESRSVLGTVGAEIYAKVFGGARDLDWHRGSNTVSQNLRRVCVALRGSHCESVRYPVIWIAGGPVERCGARSGCTGIVGLPDADPAAHTRLEVLMPTRRTVAVLLGMMILAGCDPGRRVIPRAACERPPADMKFLGEPVTVAAAEAMSLEEMKDSPDAPQVPFGFINEHWKSMTAQIRAGDRLYRYTTGVHGGYVIVRNGCVVATLVDWIV